ncbi:40-kDa huntingtin-associated protein [Taenia solium]
MPAAPNLSVSRVVVAIMNPNVEYGNLYREIAGKLQKIFRQSNVDEAKNDFAYIAKLLAAEDTYEYAAVFALGRAQCEALSSDGLAEAAALMEAGRLFARAEENLQTSSTLSSGELLEHAISCFLRAAKIYESCVSLTHAANCYIFSGDILWKFKRFSEAINVYSHAANIFCRDAPRVTQILMKCLQIYILTRDYSSALNTIFKIQTLSVDACETHGYEIDLFFDHLKETEVYRVLLVLSTLPPKSKEVSKEGPSSLAAYFDDAAETKKEYFTCCLDSDMFLYLKSLVLAYVSEDLAVLDTTAGFMQSKINPFQRRILQDLLENATNPPDDIL